MFENDSDILYYIVEVDSKRYSLFNRNTDSLILSDVNIDQIKKFLLSNNPIHPMLGSDRIHSKIPGSSPVIIPTKVAFKAEAFCQEMPAKTFDRNICRKEYKKNYKVAGKEYYISHKVTPPKPIPPPEKEDLKNLNYPSGSD